MPFISRKKKSGVALSGGTGRTNSKRIRQAGRGQSRPRPRGSESHEVPPEPIPNLGTPIISVIAATTATGTTDNTTTAGTFYFVVSLSATPPTVAQIKLGNGTGDIAGVDSGNAAPGGSPVVIAITGLTTLTAYTFHAYQESAGGGSAVVSSAEFTTL
jgi:hypothetical protein